MRNEWDCRSVSAWGNDFLWDGRWGFNIYFCFVAMRSDNGRKFRGCFDFMMAWLHILGWMAPGGDVGDSMVGGEWGCYLDVGWTFCHNYKGLIVVLYGVSWSCCDWGWNSRNNCHLSWMMMVCASRRSWTWMMTSWWDRGCMRRRNLSWAWWRNYCFLSMNWSSVHCWGHCGWGWYSRMVNIRGDYWCWLMDSWSRMYCWNCCSMMVIWWNSCYRMHCWDSCSMMAIRWYSSCMVHCWDCWNLMDCWDCCHVVFWRDSRDMRNCWNSRCVVHWDCSSVMNWDCCCMMLQVWWYISCVMNRDCGRMHSRDRCFRCRNNCLMMNWRCRLMYCRHCCMVNCWDHSRLMDCGYNSVVNSWDYCRFVYWRYNNMMDSWENSRLVYCGHNSVVDGWDDSRFTYCRYDSMVDSWDYSRLMNNWCDKNWSHSFNRNNSLVNRSNSFHRQNSFRRYWCYWFHRR